MAEEGFKRKLTAILKADAKGYSYFILIALFFILPLIGCGTTLNDAVKKGNLKAVQSVISSDKSKLEQTNLNGETPLHVAVLEGHFKLVEYLVTQGANLNARDNRGETPLHNAIMMYHTEIARYLISHGADLDIKNNIYGETALHFAVYRGNFEILKYLVSNGADINAADDYGETPLFEAIKTDHIDFVKYLIAQGANIHSKNGKGDTPLHYAAEMGLLEIAKDLVHNGAQVNAKNENGETPLFQSTTCFFGHIEVVKFLISVGADVNARDNFGNTPLHFAAECGDIEIVKNLVIKGANVNVRGSYHLSYMGLEKKSGCTPLQIASFYGHLEVVKYLVSQGADPEVKNDLGETALSLTESRGHSDIASFLSLRMQTGPQKQIGVSASAIKPKETILSDKTPPKILIFSHDISRGIKIAQKQKKVTIRGRAIDDNGIVEILINNKDVSFDKEGNFSANVYLSLGHNQIVVSAMDRYENRAYKTFTVIREHLTDLSKIGNVRSAPINYHALIIGNNNYQYLRKLQTAKKDAKAINNVLKFQYGFETKILLDATRNNIIGTINSYRRTLKEDDSLLIYYAGHGEFDQISNKAYWLPVDARSDEDTNWIIVDTVTSNIKRISSRHILVVADSCYSGTFTRRSSTYLDSASKRDRYLQKMITKKSRTLLASGGNEPVSDIGGEGHSVFAKAFLEGLKNIRKNEFTAEELYYQFIREMVAGSSDQTPEYNIIRNSGHEGGDFVFRRTN